MKFNFRKISAIGASIIMAGLTMGTAMAANYPEPFVSGGSANAAIVYGTGSGVSSLDVVESGNIQTNLNTGVTGGGIATITEGGDSYKFEKPSTKYHLGDAITAVIASALDSDELPSLLADGKFIDNDNDEIDYSQKITMAASELTMFDDNDYKEDTPTVGFKISSGSTVLTYQIAFSDSLIFNDMVTGELPIMGKDYYVLSNTSTTLTLLDSAEETVLAEGESTTMVGKSVSLDFISGTEVKLNVDGEITNSLGESDTFKLLDGSYVGIKDITAQDYQGGIKKVEFSIGTGKLKLTDGDVEVQINDETVSGLESDFDLTAAGVDATIANIELAWKADDDLFIAEDTVITMPGFDVVSMSFGGLNYPAEEVIEVQQGGDTYITLENFPLKDGVVDIDLIYGIAANSTFNEIGKDADNRLRTSNRSSGNLTFDKDTDDYFIVSWSDGSDAESYLARFTNFVLDGTDNETDFQYYKAGVWVDKKTGVKDEDTISLGNAEIRVTSINRTEKNMTISNNSANTNFYTLYSKEGMAVYLPWINDTDHTYARTKKYYFATDALACANRTLEVGPAFGELYTGTLTYNTSVTDTTNQTTTGCPAFTLYMREEDKNGNKYSGDYINVTLGWDGSTVAEVEVSSVTEGTADATSTEIGDTDIWRDFSYSALATEILFNKPSSGQKSVKIVYHGDEVAADVYVSASDAVTVVGGESGVLLVKDTEVSDVDTKNLIVVGGSCINSAAAILVGDAYCGAAWTTATGVGSGQFLIKSYASSSLTSEMALLVAGYEAADTVNAATYLRTQTVDTSTGGIGTTTTAALTTFA